MEEIVDTTSEALNFGGTDPTQPFCDVRGMDVEVEDNLRQPSR